MADFGVTPDGFVVKPLATIQSEVDDEQRANIDPGLDLDARSAQGQVNGIWAGQIAELWALGQAVYSAMYPDSANAASLDNVSSITGTTRSPTTKTTVPGVQVTLNPNKNLPAGSVANLSDQPNARFLSDVEVPATVGGGVFTVGFTAETAGATTVVPGQLVEIAEPVSGWVGVTNPNAGITGEETETDSELRIKRGAELQGGGSTNVASIRANLLQLTAVVDASVFENDGDLVDANGLLPHSIRAILRGGVSIDIAQSIFDTKSAGVNTNGAQSEVITDSQGTDHTIKFDFSDERVYYLIAVVAIDTRTFDTTNGISSMQSAVEAYIDSLPIGGDVIEDQVKCALLDIVGTVRVVSLVHTLDPSLAIASVADNGSGAARFTAAAPHGLSGGESVALTGFSNQPTYNTTGVVTLVSTTEFDVLTIAFTATDTGAFVAVEDTGDLAVAEDQFVTSDVANLDVTTTA